MATQMRIATRETRSIGEILKRHSKIEDAARRLLRRELLEEQEELGEEFYLLRDLRVIDSKITDLKNAPRSQKAKLRSELERLIDDSIEKAREVREDVIVQKKILEELTSLFRLFGRNVIPFLKKKYGLMGLQIKSHSRMLGTFKGPS